MSELRNASIAACAACSEEHRSKVGTLTRDLARSNDAYGIMQRQLDAALDMLTEQQRFGSVSEAEDAVYYRCALASRDIKETTA